MDAAARAGVRVLGYAGSEHGEEYDASEPSCVVKDGEDSLVSGLDTATAGVGNIVTDVVCAVKCSLGAENACTAHCCMKCPTFVDEDES